MREFYRDTWIEIDIDALIHNYRQFDATHAYEMIAVIKANGYGHGDVQMARLYAELGAAYLAVSSLDEALKLRHHGIELPIMVLAPVKLKDIHVAVQFEITVIAYDEGWVDALSKTALSGPLKLHLEVETGMNRIGLRQVKATCDRLSENDNVIIEGIYTHIATADSHYGSMLTQLDTFYQVLNTLTDYPFKYRHVANTATTLQLKSTQMNAHRVGIGLYGINPNQRMIKTTLDLQATFSMYTRLTKVSLVKKGEGISYGSTFVTSEDTYIGTMSVGYADGWCRSNQGRAVVIKGQECEIVGRVCMDQMMVKLPSADFAVGDVVTLIGKEMPVERVASELNTIPYEILTLISDRVPRVYKKQEVVVDCYLGRFSYPRVILR
ncbi:MAG: alanine racemase [Defluviitaleaceae bacterium]|nr:alanine racemase [Defluviitaleaceae bacterium]